MKRNKPSSSSDYHETEAPGFNPLLRAAYLMAIRTVCDEKSLCHFFPVRLKLTISPIGVEENQKYQEMVVKNNLMVRQLLEAEAKHISSLPKKERDYKKLSCLQTNISIYGAEEAKSILVEARCWTTNEKSQPKLKPKTIPAL